MLMLQPGKIGTLTLKNKICMAPMGVTIGNLTERGVAYFIERAKGGVGMILCNIAATDRFEDTSHSIFLNEETVPLFKKICDESHLYGTKICAQLMTGNGRTGFPVPRFNGPVCPSAIPWMHNPGVICHELTIDEIKEYLEDFKKSATYAVQAGADAIEIHAYGGYLTDQFLSEVWNKRTDEYGGSLENRMRFLLDKVAVAKAVGGKDFPVIVKYTPDHYMGDAAGYRHIDEGIKMAQIMEKAGVDALHIDAGCYENWYLAMPPAYIQETTLQSRSAKIIKENVSIPVLTHGRFGDPAKAEAALTHDVCDLVVIGRGLLADPDFANKLLEGRADDIRPCISCNEGCIGEVMKNHEAGCAINPVCSYEDGSRPLNKAKTPLKLLVVGAGPGGCAAALYAKQAGHEVEIWERGTELGGNALAACKPYFKLDMHRLLTYYKLQLAKAGIRVVFSREATPENVAVYKPDKLIWAAGGNPIRPAAIKGIDLPTVLSATDVLRNLVDMGNDLVVIGGGMVGIETALHLDHAGKNVTVVEMQDKTLPEPMFAMNEQALRIAMAKSKLRFLTSTKLLEVKAGEVILENADGQFVVPCDNVVLAMGFTPTQKTAENFKGVCEVLCIGDSVEPRKIMWAVNEAYDTVRALSN